MSTGTGTWRRLLADVVESSWLRISWMVEMWGVDVFSLHWKIKSTFYGLKNLLRVDVSLSLMSHISLDLHILWDLLPAFRAGMCLVGCQVDNPSRAFIYLESIFTIPFVSQRSLSWLRNPGSVCPAHSPAWLYNQPTLACVSPRLISLMSAAINRSSGIIFKADKSASSAAWYVGTATCPWKQLIQSTFKNKYSLQLVIFYDFYFYFYWLILKLYLIIKFINTLSYFLSCILNSCCLLWISNEAAKYWASLQEEKCWEHH